METMSVTSTDVPAPRPWQRRIVVVLAVLAVAHSVVLVFWLSPQSPVRQVIGGRALATYVNPYFEQSWSGLAPNAQFVDESFLVRAQVRDEDAKKNRVTTWIDITAGENEALRHDLDPARTHLMARKLATNLNGAMFGLNAKQRALVRKTYTKDPTTLLRGRLLAAGEDRRAAVETYMTYDLMATRFASMYAQAGVEGRVIAVQYRVGRRTVPPDSERATSSLHDKDFLWFSFGYRLGFRASFEAQSAFDDYLKD
jgi:hypothetical protein